MLEAVFGGRTNRQVLLYLAAYGDGYGRAMAETLELPLTAVQRQLDKLERNRVLVSRRVGRTRVYSWNPRNPLVKSLQGFLGDVLKSLSSSEERPFFAERRRPRRAGKPL